MIESARQKNFISQIDAIRAAVNSFQDRFGGFPGDSGRGSAICALCFAGNDDGILNAPVANAAALIGYTDGGIAATAAIQNKEFFSHLIGGNFLGGGAVVPPSTAPGNFAGGANPSPLPDSAFPQSGMIIVYGTHQGDAATVNNTLTNWLRVSRAVAAATTASAIIAPNRALQLDTKYDDASPSQGRIRGDSLSTGCGEVAGSPAVYATTTAVLCSFLVQLE